VLAFTYILLVVIVALTVPLALNLRARARTEAEKTALLSAQTIAAGIGRENVKEGRKLNHLVVAYATQLGGRVLVTDPDGIVLADSQGDAVGKDYANRLRPEMRTALGMATTPDGTPIPAQPDSLLRYSTDLNAQLLAAAAPVLDEGRVYGAVRLTNDVTDVVNQVRNVTIGIAVVGAFGLIAGLIIAFGLAESLSRPLAKLAAASKRIGSGDLSARAGDIGGAAEIKDLASSFDDMAGRVERTVRSQREFVANASHQLRTPLTGMKLRLESAAAESHDPELRRQIEAADHEIDRMAETVNRMLVMANEVEQGEATLIDLRVLADAAAARWHERAEQLETTLDAGGVRADTLANPADLEQVIDNLIDNALAYAAGPIELETGERDSRVFLSVRDHGAGIPTEERGRVTERFYRGRGVPSGGSGLGLAIARELCEKWGGSLEITDADGGGARIELRLRPVEGPSAATT
jgi:signal transduction histidine kinase